MPSNQRTIYYAATMGAAVLLFFAIIFPRMWPDRPMAISDFASPTTAPMRSCQSSSIKPQRYWVYLATGSSFEQHKQHIGPHLDSKIVRMFDDFIGRGPFYVASDVKEELLHSIRTDANVEVVECDRALEFRYADGDFLPVAPDLRKYSKQPTPHAAIPSIAPLFDCTAQDVIPEKFTVYLHSGVATIAKHRRAIIREAKVDLDALIETTFSFEGDEDTQTGYVARNITGDALDVIRAHAMVQMVVCERSKASFVDGTAAGSVSYEPHGHDSSVRQLPTRAPLSNCFWPWVIPDSYTISLRPGRPLEEHLHWLVQHFDIDIGSKIARSPWEGSYHHTFYDVDNVDEATLNGIRSDPAVEKVQCEIEMVSSLCSYVHFESVGYYDDDGIFVKRPPSRQTLLLHRNQEWHAYLYNCESIYDSPSPAGDWTYLVYLEAGYTLDKHKQWVAEQDTIDSQYELQYEHSPAEHPFGGLIYVIKDINETVLDAIRFDPWVDLVECVDHVPTANHAAEVMTIDQDAV